MIIGILMCGTPHISIVNSYGDCGKIFHTFLNSIGFKIQVKCFDCTANQFPTQEDYQELDGFIITGSKYSSYDDKVNNIEWISQLKSHVREMNQRKIKLVGICFGHQVIAESLGGKVTKNPLGWEVSVSQIYTNELGKHLLKHEALFIQEMHKDIVSNIEGTGLQEIAYNDYGIQGMIKDNHIFTLQGHPEYNSFIISEFLKKRKDVIGSEMVNDGLQKIFNKTDTLFFSEMIVTLFSN